MNARAIVCGVIGVLLGIVLVVLLCTCWTSVPAGHVAVVTSFGQVQGEPLESGFHFIAPWKNIHKISLQTQEEKETATVPTKEGLTVALEVSLLYSVKKDKVSDLYTSVGLKYEEVVVMPQFRSALRGITVKYDAKDLYTANRAEIEAALEKAVTALLEERGILCENVLLRSIELPPLVKAAIEKKLASEQEAAAMEFVILKEKKDAERKRVEAKGIADAQEIIHQTLTPEYLRYLWIKSLDNAASHNGTIIYIPTGNDGMPLFKEVGAKPATAPKK